MNSFKTLFQRYKHGWILSYAIVYLAAFFYLENRNVTQFYTIHMNLDDKIPFLEIFIIPYFFWFAYIIAGVLFIFFCSSKKEFNQCCGYLFLGMTVFLVISYIFPNQLQLRPAHFDRDNIFIRMVQSLYRTDTATNVFPSIHVYNSVVMHVVLRKNRWIKEHPHIRSASFIIAFSIVISTVFLKQHSLWDVFGGLFMAVCFYPIFYPKAGTTSESTHQISI